MPTFATTLTNDLALTANAVGKKNLTLERDEVVNGAAKINRRIQFFEGEWFLDFRQGFPWFKFVLVKNPDLTVIRRLLRTLIMSVDIVATVKAIDLTFDPKIRKLDCSFEAIADDGRKIFGGIGKPFIVTERTVKVQGGSL